MNTYQMLKAKQQKEVNEFPMAYAFGQKQFEEAMKKLGLEPSEKDKVCSLYGAGDIIRKSDVPEFLDMSRRHKQEIKDAIAADKTGDGFIFDMFSVELADHEFCITGSYDDALAALNLTYEDIAKDKRLAHGLKKAADEDRKFHELLANGKED